MKLLIIILAAGLMAAFFHTGIAPGSTDARKEALARVKQFRIRCSPLLTGFNPADSSNLIPLLSGWGNYHMKVTTANDSALIYFEQGINMYYSFHVIEALASFERAVQFDTSFAMGYWGKALAYGPNINDFGYSASPEALAAMNKAKMLAITSPAPEQALIEAMQLRYTADTTQSREKLNQLYATGMKKVHARFPANPDVAALYVDALMVQHPWDLYSKDYIPRPWTAEIVNTLERTLAKYPDHPGAAHYYIHAVEASQQPQKALVASRKLGRLMPGVAHIVHMPSHIFIRSGYYAEGEKVNQDAVKGYYGYLGKYGPVANSAPLYLIHNLHMQATCANMKGNYASSMKASVDCRNSFDTGFLSAPDYPGIFIQYVYMTPVLTGIRFGKWEDILSMPAVPSRYVYANFLQHYARGMAVARKHDFAAAAKQLDTVLQLMGEPQLKAPAPSYANPGIAGAEVATKILQGVIAEEKGELSASIANLKQGVILEDSMIYNEPKDWVHPARQYLGSVLLKAKKYQEAAMAFRQDLAINPNNGWSLTGLSQALSGMGQAAAAKETAVKAGKAFAGTDMRIAHAVF